MTAEKDDRPVLLAGHKVALTLMRKEDVPVFARWESGPGIHDADRYPG